MEDSTIRELVAAVAAGDAESAAAWEQLKPLGAAVVPHLAAAYPTTRRWQGRVALVFHSIRFARESPAAVELGLAALRDRATLVRYRACGLLAYSLRRDTVPALRALLQHPDLRTREDAEAAIAAIQAQNHHRFIDRDGSGRSFWTVNPGDTPLDSPKGGWQQWLRQFMNG